MNARLAVSAICSLTFGAAFLSAQRFSLDQALSAPCPSNLVASPTGNKIAWVFDSRGVRNVWIAESPDFKARQLTSYTRDDGQEIGSVVWSSDSAAVAYTRAAEKPTARGRFRIPPIMPPVLRKQSTSSPRREALRARWVKAIPQPSRRTARPSFI